MTRYGNLLVGESTVVDCSITGDRLLLEWELGWRATFHLLHHDDTVFGDWL